MSLLLIQALDLFVAGCGANTQRSCKVSHCAAKKERYYGWQLHMICDAHCHPVSFELLPATWDELTHVQDLLTVLLESSKGVADKGYISQLDELLAYFDCIIRLVPKYRKNIQDNSPEDVKLIRQNCSMIETVNSQLESTGLQRIRTRSNAGIMASLWL